MLNNILDISHYQGGIDFKKVADAGIVAVIHKKDEGAGKLDPMYISNHDKILDAGLLLGAYHFIRRDGIPEAKSFILNLHNPTNSTILALDFEVAIPVSECEKFVQEIFDETGKYPLFYINYSGMNSGEISEDSVLKNCPLWIARYRSTPPLVPEKLWSTWTLWQYTQTGRCDGINGFVDRNNFNGSDVAQIKDFWNCPVPAIVQDAEAPTASDKPATEAIADDASGSDVDAENQNGEDK